jgi:4-amino-4-deoxy-L-arabinose transferase-like glycosyltransferase
VALLAAAGTLWRGKRPPAAIGGVALLVLPLAWALSPIFTTGNLTLPSASLPRWLGLSDGRGPLLSRNFAAVTDDPRLLDFLAEHREGARYLVAAPTTRLVAPIIIRTGQPALPVGGYFGNEPILSVDQVAKLVASGELRYALIPADIAHRRPSPFTTWVRAHGTPIDASQWRSVTVEGRRGIELYALKPDRR